MNQFVICLDNILNILLSVTLMSAENGASAFFLPIGTQKHIHIRWLLITKFVHFLSVQSLRYYRPVSRGRLDENINTSKHLVRYNLSISMYHHIESTDISCTDLYVNKKFGSNYNRFI